ncbi:hypothetical protein ACHAP8_008595 [Fusarium lateritium]
MSTSKVNENTESMLLTPFFQESSQALLLPTQDTDADTLAHSAEQSRTNEYGPTNEQDTDLEFVIRQAAVTCDSRELSAAPKEDTGYKQWSLELLVLLFAGAIFTSICVILGHYHHEVLPDWQDLRITLNAVISILATVLRTAIAFIVFEILAQLKWEWVSTCFRPLYHVQLFDAASRGVYGSLRLFPTIVRHEPFAVAAIAIAVLSLGIGSFTQQSIQTYQCLRNVSYDHDTFIRIANTVNENDLTDRWDAGGEVPTRMNLKTQVTIQDAIVNQVRDYHLAPLFKCSSGNCTFQNDYSFTQDDESEPYSHASLGVCNRCIDMYSLVTGPTFETTDGGETLTLFTLPHPQYPEHGIRGKASIAGKNNVSAQVMITTTVDNFTWATDDVVTPEFLRLAQFSVVNFTILTTSQSNCRELPGGNMSCPYDCENRKESTFRDGKTCLPHYEDPSYSFDPVAAACTLYPCLKYHTAYVKNARLEEKVVQQVPLQLQGHGSRWEKYSQWMRGENATFAAFQQPCLVDEVLYTNENISLAVTNEGNLLNTSAPLTCVYEMPKSIWLGLRNELLFGLNSVCTSMDNGGVQCKVRRTKDEVGHQNNGMPSYPTHLAALFHNGTASVETITKKFDALATRLTTAIRLEGKTLGMGEEAKVRGKLQENTICVKFVWKWLIFPGALLASTTVLLLAIVVKDTAVKKTKVWKSSILPLLLKDDLGRENTGLDSLEEVAQGLEVKLQ